MKRRNFLTSLAVLPAITRFQDPRLKMAWIPGEYNPRKYWCDLAEKLAFPILSALAAGELKKKMPVEVLPGHEEERRKVTNLEAIGRLITGIAPWLQLPDEDSTEGNTRKKLLNLYYQSISHAVDPLSPDFMNFTEGNQPLVDSAFLALGLMRAPRLYGDLDSNVRQQLIRALRSTRAIKPPMNNWLLFSATIEAFFLKTGEEYNPDPIDFALKKHLEWYKGDGVYGDGPMFHWDYYNSFVIQPMLLEVLKVLVDAGKEKPEIHSLVLRRAQRYAEILERLVSPEGTIPPIGRSLPYRSGAFHLLAHLALNYQLPDSLKPGQVRSALTAVIKRTMEAEGTFDKNGWLQIGFCGAQPGIAESYISTGSLYLCTAVLLPLGLTPEDPFWSGPDEEWTAKKIWHGQDIKPDHAIED